MTIALLLSLALILAIVVLGVVILACAMLRSGGYDVVSYMCLGILFGATLMFFMSMVIII
jgi:hypothetical protein